MSNERRKGDIIITDPQESDEQSLTYKLDKIAINLIHAFPNHSFIECMVEARKILDLNYEEMRGENKTIYR